MAMARWGLEEKRVEEEGGRETVISRPLPVVAWWRP